MHDLRAENGSERMHQELIRIDDHHHETGLFPNGVSADGRSRNDFVIVLVAVMHNAHVHRASSAECTE
jgi:hypothetical protein